MPATAAGASTPLGLPMMLLRALKRRRWRRVMPNGTPGEATGIDRAPTITRWHTPRRPLKPEAMMGEIAQAILDGLLDEETGELIDGDAPGYPRRAGAVSDQLTRRASQATAMATGLPFPCPGCGRSFKHKGDLRVHRRDKSH